MGFNEGEWGLKVILMENPIGFQWDIMRYKIHHNYLDLSEIRASRDTVLPTATAIKQQGNND